MFNSQEDGKKVVFVRIVLVMLSLQITSKFQGLKTAMIYLFLLILHVDMCEQGSAVLTSESKVLGPLPDAVSPVIVAGDKGHGELCIESPSFHLVVTYVIAAHISLAKQIIWSYQGHKMRKYNLTMSPEKGVPEISANHNKTEEVDSRDNWEVELIGSG